MGRSKKGREREGERDEKKKRGREEEMKRGREEERKRGREEERKRGREEERKRGREDARKRGRDEGRKDGERMRGERRIWGRGGIYEDGKRGGDHESKRMGMVETWMPRSRISRQSHHWSFGSTFYKSA